MSPSVSSHRGPFAEIELDGPAAAGSTPRPLREARLPNFIGLSEPAAPRLDALRVMVVGCGSVGANLVLHAARLQVGEIWIVDPGQLKAESLLTHPMDPNGVGLDKVEYFGRLAKAISPNTRVCVFAGPVEALPLSAFGAVEMVALATDNLAAEVEVGQRAIYHRRPLLQASVHGDTLVAQVRLWLNRDGAGPCPACSFGAAEWDHVNRQTHFECQPGSARQEAHVETLPTMSVSFLCSMSAEMAMMQLLRLVLQLGSPQQDSMLEYCGYTNQVSTSRLKRNLACSCEHVAWDRISLDRSIAQSSLKEIARRAGFDPHTLAHELSFVVDEFTFAEQVVCCAGPQPVHRFCEADTEVARCSVCARALRPQRFYSHRPTPASALWALLDEPLESLGGGGAEWVVVRAGGRTVFCQEEV